MPNDTALAGLVAFSVNGANGPLASNSSNTDTGFTFVVLAGAAAEATVANYFSEFYLTGTSAPLPVGLLSFTAAAEGNAARLQWTIASEQHSARSEVQWGWQSV
ncbi:hypothetical protein Q5H93_12590 [Hymenobacter sp. ASUV-10]|uniref:Uncharacterized protein n=1 Tax=Hymenobacter aranciens TaxID=3063996 RepID=A0ABT9BD26_9BACT|nr:hypothetical protein [Hymenobacter sp. ASUV-10]MDO7875573.1 hypothetical protein [Hymenobacter sp. ASUV-10]